MKDLETGSIDSSGMPGVAHPPPTGQFTARAVPGDMLTIAPSSVADVPRVRPGQQTVTLTIDRHAYHGFMWSENLTGPRELRGEVTIETPDLTRPRILRDAAMRLLRIRHGAEELVVALPGSVFRHLDEVTAPR